MFHTTFFKQTVVYWETNGLDDYGKPVYKEPVEIKSRWEDVNELFINRLGEQVRSLARVFVQSDLDERGILLLGKLEDLSEAQKSNPMSIKRAYSIKSIKKIPNLKADKFVRTVWL